MPNNTPEYKHTYYIKNKARIIAQQKEYRSRNRLKARKWALDYYHRDKAKSREQSNRTWNKYKSAYYPRKLARNSLRDHVRRGKIKKPKRCQQCNKRKRLEAHHHKGYSKQHRLDVKWLCIDCHVAADSRGSH